MTTGKIIGVLTGLTVAVVGGVYLYDFWRKSQPAKPSEETKTGKVKEKEIVELKGEFGKDDGLVVKGYKLPDKIEDNKFPLTVIVKPNEDVFGLEVFTGGKKLTFDFARGSDAIWRGNIDGASGEYSIWYEQLKEKALGAIS